MKRKIRISEVAVAAGVSTQTVSRVLNNRPEVLAETRQRVLETIATLGYEPSLFARGLAGNRSHIIGMIAEDLSEPMMAHFIAAVELEVKKHGYFLVVSSNVNPTPEQPIHARMLTASHVDGLLFSRLGQYEQEKAYLNDLLARNIPMVALGDWPTVQGTLSSVGLAEENGGYQATRYLLGLGHRHIGMITGPIENSAAQSRSKGYERALLEFGITLDKNLIVVGDWTFGSGFRAAQKLSQQRPEISAVFCQNDRMAIAAIQALQQSGRLVPSDVSIIGFDDIPDAAYTNPALTTMHQSADEIGREAARLLLETIDNPSSSPQRVEIEATLIERNSCCPR